MSSPQRRISRRTSDVPGARTVEGSVPSPTSSVHTRSPVREAVEFTFSNFLAAHPGLSKVFEDKPQDEVPMAESPEMSPPPAIALHSPEGRPADQSIVTFSSLPQETQPPDISEDDGDVSEDSLMEEILQLSSSIRYFPFSEIRAPVLQTLTAQSSISSSASLASATSEISRKSRISATRPSRLTASRTYPAPRVPKPRISGQEDSPVSRASSETSISECRSPPTPEISSPRVSIPLRLSPEAEISECETPTVSPILSRSLEYERFLQNRTPPQHTSTASYQFRQSSSGSEQDTYSSTESPTPVTVIEKLSQHLAPTIDKLQDEEPMAESPVISPPPAIALHSPEGRLADQSVVTFSSLPQERQHPDIIEDDGDRSENSLIKEILQLSSSIRYSPFSEIRAPVLQTLAAQSSISSSASLASATSEISRKSRISATRPSRLTASRTYPAPRVPKPRISGQKDSPVSRASSKTSISECRSPPTPEISSPRVSIPLRLSPEAEISECETPTVSPILSRSLEYERFLQNRTPPQHTSTASYQFRQSSSGSEQDENLFPTEPSVLSPPSAPAQHLPDGDRIIAAFKSKVQEMMGAVDTSQGDSSDSSQSHYQPFASYLDTASALFLERRRTPPRTRPSTGKLPFSTAIDPYAVGIVVIQKALRENTWLDDQLKMDEQSLDWRQKRGPCPCDVPKHPSHWSADNISDIHHYSFLLETQGLRLSPERVVASNSRETIVVYNVPMVDGHPWKVKAEQVLRFVDVETSFGDQTAYNLLYYTQPCDRKIFIIVASQKVRGLVVAEKLQWAHRILSETMMYRDLEEDPVPVRVGINRLWIHVSMRRQHLATTLCRIVGNFFYEGEKLHREDFAFNNVSDAGVAFAKLFLRTHRVPLYDGKTGKTL